MMNLSPFTKFMSSLSQISRWNYAVWDADRAVFSSGNERSKIHVSEAMRRLSTKVISNGNFQHALSQGNYELYGIPIKNSEKVLGSLLAYAPIRSKASRTKDIYGLKRGHARQMEKFLASLVRLIEDKWSSDQEVREITEELTQSLEDINLYSNVTTRIKTLTFSRTMLKDLAEQLLGTIRTEMVFTRLPDHLEYDMFLNKKDIGEKISDPNAFVDALINAIPEKISPLDKDYFLVADSRMTPEYTVLHPETFRFLAVRIQHKNNFYGWLGLVSFNLKEIFRRSELRLMSTMAEQLALVMTNTEIYADLERFAINVVKSFIQAIEAKDRYTRGHSERVNRYVMLAAARLKLNEGERKVLNWASLLHDIGKIGIPESILNKAGSLTDEEYSIIKSHPEKGCKILQPLQQLSSSLPGILHHHERYDGHGYPHGLRGENIPLSARIITVADTFDAITSARSYRPGKTVKEAIEIMDKVAGSQLAPDLVEVFKEAIKEDTSRPQRGCRILAA